MTPAKTGRVPDSAGQVPDTKPAGAGQVPVSVAADILGVSERTVRRYLSLGTLAKVPDSKPVLVDLDASELTQEKPAKTGRVPDSAGQVPDTKPAGAGQVPVTDQTELVAVLGARVEDLRAQVEDLQARLDASETERRTLAREKDQALIWALEGSRRIEPPPKPEPPAEPDPVIVTTPPTTPKRRFWQRWRSN